MNGDEFKFLIVNTPSLWQEGKIESDVEGKDSIEITEEGLSLRRYYTHVLTNSYPFVEFSPVDFALDSCGLLYILDSKEKRLAVFDTNARTYEFINCILFSKPRLIAIDHRNIYIADDNRICCLARENFQTRWEVSIEGGEPVDMALDRRQNVYVLEKNSSQIYRIDRTGKLITLTLSTVLNEPVNIALDNENNLYVLEFGEKKVLKFDSQGTLESTISLLEPDFQPSALAVDIHGNLYIGDRRTGGTLYQVDSSGTTKSLGYRGTARRIIASRCGDLYILGESEIALLKLVEKYINKGTYITRRFDSTTPECRWHKMVAEAEIPANTQMSVSYYIADAGTLPSAPEWSTPVANFKDALILSAVGRYIWFRLELVSDDLNSSSPKVNNLRVYLPRMSYLRYLPATYQEDATGREFLERFLSLFETVYSDLEEANLAITRYIDVVATPDSFVPWLSAWLAIAYDEKWGVEKIRKLIEKAPALYKKRGTREGLKELIQLYTGEEPIIIENFQYRSLQPIAIERKLAKQAYAGESQLLVNDASVLVQEEVVRIISDTKEEFAVIEHKYGNILKLRSGIAYDYKPGSTVRKMAVEEVLFGDCPFKFCILLKPSQVKDTGDFIAVDRIIQREKPAHTVGGLRLLQPWIYLDMHTYLGLNTYLTEPVFILEKSSVISRDTALASVEESGQVELRSRVAIDTKLT